MVAIGNPILGFLHPRGWARPAGNTEMVVTQSAAEHMSSQYHPAGPPALDIGDGDPDLDSIFAVHAGKVTECFVVGSANLSIDFYSDGKKWRYVLAHNTLPHPVVVGQNVTEGQQVGKMGSTGANAVHLHIQLGWWDGFAWHWVDPWPYLRQNGATEGEDMTPIPASKFTPLVNKLTKVTLAGGATFRADRFNNAKALKLYAQGTAFTPLCYADDGDPSPVSKRWYGGLGGTDAGIEFGWLQEGALAPISDATPPPDLTAAFNEGVDAAAVKSLTAKKP